MSKAWELQFSGPVEGPEGRYKPLVRVRISYRVDPHEGHPTQPVVRGLEDAQKGEHLSQSHRAMDILKVDHFWQRIRQHAYNISASR